jgi:hypothetical protein
VLPFLSSRQSCSKLAGNEQRSSNLKLQDVDFAGTCQQSEAPKLKEKRSEIENLYNPNVQQQQQQQQLLVPLQLLLEQQSYYPKEWFLLDFSHHVFI